MSHVKRNQRPGKTQTGLLNYRDYLQSWNFGHSKYRYYTIPEANNKSVDQTAFVVRIWHKKIFSCRGWFDMRYKPSSVVNHLGFIFTFKLMIFEARHDKTNKISVRPAKTQISLGIRPVWSESSLSAWWKLGSLTTHYFAGRTVTLLFCHVAAHFSDDFFFPSQPWLNLKFDCISCRFFAFLSVLSFVFLLETTSDWPIPWNVRMSWIHCSIVVISNSLFIRFLLFNFLFVLFTITLVALYGEGVVRVAFPLGFYSWATSWENLFCHMRTTSAQISLRIRAVWSAPLLFAA